MNNKAHAFRLPQGVDLRKAIERYVREHGIRAGCIATCIGGLSSVALRMPGATSFSNLEGIFEIVSASGTLSVDGSHIHLSLSDGEGAVLGGHLEYGSTVRLSAEIVVLEFPHLAFSREHDPDTGFRELVIETAENAENAETAETAETAEEGTGAAEGPGAVPG
jgi:predicted DNA-binding protein with PD1-like motif